MSERWITVAIKVPEGYEDVCDQLVAEDCMQNVVQHGWEWGFALPDSPQTPLAAPSEAKPSGKEVDPMDPKTAEVLIAMLNLMAELRKDNPAPMSDEEFFAYDKKIRDLIG